MLLAVVLSLALVAFNLLTNRHPSHEAVYLARNLAAGVGLVAVARWAGLTWEDLGLAPADLDSGLVWGGVVAGVVALGAAVAGVARHRVPVLRRALVDQRADLVPARLAFQVAVRIPVGTAAFEELAFRGVLLAAWAVPLSTAGAVAAQAVAFGLWHVGPTRLSLRINARTDPDLVRRDVAVAVVVTAVGGVAFALLRLGSGSLLAPVLAHTSTNVAGLLLAAATTRGTAASRG